MTHNELVKEAKEAIEAVFSDTTVPTSKTRESLEELACEIEGNLEAIANQPDED